MANKQNLPTIKQRVPREEQEFTRNSTHSPLYSLEKVHTLDWKLFMWFASLKKVENYIDLFIVIWDAGDDKDYYPEEFKEETNNLIHIIKELGIIGYPEILNDYKNNCFRRSDRLRQRLVNNAWAELEEYGLARYSHAVERQLKNLTPEQKIELGMMISDRMYSFYCFAKQVKENVIKPKDDEKQLLEKENNDLKNQMTITDKENSLQINNLQNGKDELARKLENAERQLEDLKAEKEALKEQLNKKRTMNESLNKIESETILYEGNGTKKSRIESKNETEYSIESPKEELHNKISVENSEIVRSKQENAMLTARGKTDVEWRDDDENNSTQLVKDIENLNRALNRITGVKRVSGIKDDAVAELFSSLNCKTSVKSNQMKLVLDAALQQHLINFILSSADTYISEVKTDMTDMTDDDLEAAILSRTKELIELTDRFEGTRSRTDELSRELQIKFRQQSYATLGNRGFPIDHPFVTRLTKDLINEMNRYRVIDEKKIKKFEEDIIKIIIKVLRIFYFRLYTQEPIPTMKFYKNGDDIDPVFMEGMWEGPYEDYEVEICSFPVIYTEFDDRVYTRAQVIARPKEEVN